MKKNIKSLSPFILLTILLAIFTSASINRGHFINSKTSAKIFQIIDTTFIPLIHDTNPIAREFYYINVGNLRLQTGGNFSVGAGGGVITFSIRNLLLTDTPVADYLNSFYRSCSQDSLIVINSAVENITNLSYDIVATIQGHESTNDRLITISDGFSGISVSVYQASGGQRNPAFHVLPDPPEDSTEQTEPYPDVTPIPQQDNETLSNWIKTITYTSESPTASSGFYSDVTYYNGIGLPKQVIQIGAGANSHRNVVTPVMYDPLCRAARTYLPYVAASNNAQTPESAPVTAQLAYYRNLFGATESAPFSNKVMEASSDRVLKQFDAGSIFITNNKYTKSDFLINSVNDSVPLLRINSAGNIVTYSGLYDAGTLSKTITTDADGHKKAAFADITGQTVMERFFISNTKHYDTQYVRNDKGQLVLVVTPEGSAHLESGSNITFGQPFAANWCYTYIYDGRGNMIEKKLPGKDAEKTVYDIQGRPILYQDGKLAQLSRWIFLVYDNLGRTVEKSLLQSSASLPLESFVNQCSQQATNRFYYAVNCDTILPPTTYRSYFIKIASLERHRYGDTQLGAAGSMQKFQVPAYLAFASVSGLAETSDVSSKTDGLQIYERMACTNNLGSVDGYTERAFYYDYRNRVIQSVEKNLNGGIDRTSFKYNFVGNILARQERISPTSGGTETVKNTLYTYDQRGRLLTETTTVDGTAQGTVSYAYDDLGKLITRTGGNGTAEHTTYNLQGWTTAKNTLNASSANIFSQQLAYYNPQKGTTPLYTGNISEWAVTQGADATSTFGFSYDNMCRLTNTNRYEGAGTTASSTFTERNLNYDANGNILTLSRYGADAATPEDNFTYTYNGNKLMNLAGTNGGTALSGANYTYDGNGNMTHDGRMNLDVTYDLFGMPQSVQQNGTLKCAYTYLADGTKVMVQDDANSSSSNGYLYLGSMVFRKTGTSYAFESTDFGGGRITNVNGTLSPYYYTTDHLGSVRVITDASGNVVERNDYYPFGKRMTTGNTYPTTSSNRWKYNGKEVQTTGNVNWLDYGAREYDEVIGRWTRPDPMSEKYYGTSGYAYCVDNPITHVDPTGQLIDDYFDKKWKFFGQG